MNALHILCLEDSPLEVELIHAILTAGGVECEILRVQTRAAFAVALESGDFDLILADYSLPSFDGLSALRVAQEIRPEVPFVLVSETVWEETAIETLKGGATDYVLKQRLERLVPAVRRAVREAEERTARKRTEEALQYQLDLTTTITDNAADSLFLWDAEGRVTFMNPAAEQTFGWRQEELLGEVLHDRMHHHHPDGRPYPVSECPLVRVFESAQTLRDHEDVFFRKDGSPIDVSCSLAPIVVSGEIMGAVLVVRDIIERKRAEKALQISETRFRTIIEQSPLSIQILSPDGRTLQVNRAWETLWGVTLDDVAGYNLLEDQQLAAKGIMPYIQRGFAGEPTSIPPIIYDPDETLPGLTSHEEPMRWVKAFIQPIKDEAGTVREVVLMHEDITERKQAEEELRDSEERFRRTFEQAAVGIAHVGT